MFGIDDLLALACGASPEYFSESTILSWFWAGGGAGAWSVLRILVGIDDPLVVLGGCQRWRVEHLENSARSRRPAVLGGRRRWRVERLQNNFWN